MVTRRRVYVFDEDPDGDAGYQLSEALDVLEQGYVQIDSGLLVDDSPARALQGGMELRRESRAQR